MSLKNRVVMKYLATVSEAQSKMCLMLSIGDLQSLLYQLDPQGPIDQSDHFKVSEV